MQRTYIGIDPGQVGAAALIGADGLALVEPWLGDVVAAAGLLRGWTARYRIELAALERVASRPGQGVASTFTFGANFGAWQGCLAALGIPSLLPTPAQWQRGLVLPSDGPDPKARSLAVARRLYPTIDLHRKGDHGKADALLLAHYARHQARG